MREGLPLENTGQNGARRGADVKALEAWALTRGSRRVTLAVIDDGFDLGHSDLSAPGKIAAPYDFGEDDPDPSPGLSLGGRARGRHHLL